MRRSLFVFVVGLIAGIAVVVTLAGPLNYDVLCQDAGKAMETASRGAQRLQLEARVRTALALQKDFDLFGGISVAVEDDIITLSGTVATIEQQQLAELIAKGVDGVEDVINALEIHTE